MFWFGHFFSISSVTIPKFKKKKRPPRKKREKKKKTCFVKAGILLIKLIPGKAIHLVMTIQNEIHLSIIFFFYSTPLSKYLGLRWVWVNQKSVAFGHQYPTAAMRQDMLAVAEGRWRISLYLNSRQQVSLQIGLKSSGCFLLLFFFPFCLFFYVCLCTQFNVLAHIINGNANSKHHRSTVL